MQELLATIIVPPAVLIGLLRRNEQVSVRSSLMRAGIIVVVATLACFATEFLIALVFLVKGLFFGLLVYCVVAAVGIAKLFRLTRRRSAGYAVLMWLSSLLVVFLYPGSLEAAQLI